MGENGGVEAGMRTMDIFKAKDGSKVRFLNKNGYEFERNKAAEFLVEGQVYTVDRVEIHNWHTDVWLKEVPGFRFNSVHFDDVLDIETTESESPSEAAAEPLPFEPTKDEMND